MAGKNEIGAFLGRVKASNVQLKITDEIVGGTRAAFCLTVVMASGKRIIEHIIVHYAGGNLHVLVLECPLEPRKIKSIATTFHGKPRE